LALLAQGLVAGAQASLPPGSKREATNDRKKKALWLFSLFGLFSGNCMEIRCVLSAAGVRNADLGSEGFG
jgi:hypothetical protein